MKVQSNQLYNVYQKERASSEDKSTFPKYADWKADFITKNEVVGTKPKSTKTKAEPKPVEVKEKKVTKKSQAVDIYKSMMDGSTHPVRKDVMNAFKSQLNMTDAGSSTYWFNIKKELSQ